MSNEELDLGFRLIEEEDLSVVVIKDGDAIAKRRGRGILPLVSLYEEKLLKDAVVVDRILGRAAALVCRAGGVLEVGAMVGSNAAIQVLEKGGIKTVVVKTVEKIMNRRGDGCCPFEKEVQGIEDPLIGVARVKDLLEKLGLREEGDR